MDTNTLKRFTAKVEITDSCHIWTASKTRTGYGYFRADGRTDLAHRVAYKLYNGEIPRGMYVIHACDNPSCVNPEHLAIGTQSDNILDCVMKNRHPKQKLTESDVTAMREKYESTKTTMTALAKEYGVDKSTVRLAIRGLNWSHLKHCPKCGYKTTDL